MNSRRNASSVVESAPVFESSFVFGVLVILAACDLLTDTACVSETGGFTSDLAECSLKNLGGFCGLNLGRGGWNTSPSDFCSCVEAKGGQNLANFPILLVVLLLLLNFPADSSSMNGWYSLRLRVCRFEGWGIVDDGRLMGSDGERFGGSALSTWSCDCIS